MNEIGTRSLCTILDDMRKCTTTLNFSYLSGLIEEAQYRANRMENALDTYGANSWNGIKELEEKRIELKEEIKKLIEEKRKRGK